MKELERGLDRLQLSSRPAFKAASYMPLRKLEPLFTDECGEPRVWTRGSLTLLPRHPGFPSARFGLKLKSVAGEVSVHREDLSVQVHPGDAYAELHHKLAGQNRRCGASWRRKGARSPPASVNR
jgi:hypothetical protein